MQARVEILIKHVSDEKVKVQGYSIYQFAYHRKRDEDKFRIYLSIECALELLDPEFLAPGKEFSGYLHRSSRTNRNSKKKSELVRQEECDAFAFFVALVQRYYSTDARPLTLAPELLAFLEKLKINRDRLENYHEMVHWGQLILNDYQRAIESHQDPIVTPAAQDILAKAAAPQIFVNPKAYKKALVDEKVQRYSKYIEARQKYRAQVPKLQEQLSWCQLQRSLGTLVSLIPGVYFLKEGLSEIWMLLKKGSIGGALISFVLHGIVSAISPLGALCNYFGYGLLLDNVEKAIAEADAGKDYVVTRVLNASEYSDLKNFRKDFKRQLQKTVSDNPTKIFNKPQKHVERFADSHGEKVRVFLDKQQAQRFDAYQDFRFGRRTDTFTFFKGLEASQQESRVTVEKLNIECEKLTPQAS